MRADLAVAMRTFHNLRRPSPSVLQSIRDHGWGLGSPKVSGQAAIVLLESASTKQFGVPASMPFSSQNHPFLLKYQSTPTIERTMSALAYHTPCGLFIQGRCRFIPKKPVITTRGSARVP